MKILHVASEAVPFAKTGGLADVVGTLPKVLVGMGHEVAVALPKYKPVSVDKFKLRTLIPSLRVPFGDGLLGGAVRHTKTAEGVNVFLIDRPEFFDRDGLYGHLDDPERFIFFDRAVLEMLKAANWAPDVIHCHDWQTGFIPAYLKSLYAGDTFFSKTASVFSIHNLAYQGVCPKEKLTLTRLPESMFNYHELEFYGQLNPMKGGLVYADMLSTVSEKYAQEIQTAEYGERLEGALVERKESLIGILNGIDYEEWNPAKDPFITHPFDGDRLSGKASNKKALQLRGHLPGAGRKRIPLIGCVSRLSSQKGFDLVAKVAEAVMALNVQLVILGAGDEHYTRMFESIAAKYPDQTYMTLGKFDNELAHQIYAGSDLFLMPSRYEPCGLGQLISLAYGTIPIVRATGGLADTIEEYQHSRKAGNGFVFEDYSADGLLGCIQRAVKTYRVAAQWKPLVSNALKCDFSWNVSARKYVHLYQRAVSKRLAGA